MAVALVGVLMLGVVSAGLYLFNASSPSNPLVWQLCLIGMSWLAAAIGVCQFLRQLPVGELAFDGVDWYFFDKTGDEKAGSERVGFVRVRFDGQNCFLLRFEDDLKKANWLWLEARHSIKQSPSAWLDVRRAVYSRATAQNLPNVI